ncbi:MAG: transporter ATP-binding protein [Acidimicrobiales bacterium]|jgi:putative ABC transport system ATP-binding protein|nr:transporter ATP-binding protein [Acidimicrobiales bacterium]
MNDDTAVAAVELSGVVKTYGDEADADAVNAVRGIDLSIAVGEFVAVVGPSGSGKSTLLHLIGALDAPTAGEVRVEGTPLSSLDRQGRAHLRSRRIGFVFQLYNLLPSLTVEENVSLPARIAGDWTAERRARVDDLLDAVGLTAKRTRWPAQLSGGEQQRVAVARALVMRPAVVLADEPTGNLDSEAGRDVMAVINRAHAEGQTIVMVTHDLRIAAQAARVITLRDGVVVDDARMASEGTSKIARMVALGDDCVD